MTTKCDGISIEEEGAAVSRELGLPASDLYRSMREATDNRVTRTDAIYTALEMDRLWGGE